MPSIELRASTQSHQTDGSNPSPLPPLLQTPSGLAIVEIQGTIHGPFPTPGGGESTQSSGQATPIGRLEFPLYDPQEPGEGKWMKKVYLYVGKHQRLTGEVKKLVKPLAVVRKIDGSGEDGNERSGSEKGEELEIVDVVKFKVLFSGRPEPMGQ